MRGIGKKGRLKRHDIDDNNRAILFYSIIFIEKSLFHDKNLKHIARGRMQEIKFNKNQPPMNILI